MQNFSKSNQTYEQTQNKAPFSKSDEVDTYNSLFLVVLYHTLPTYKDTHGNPSPRATYYCLRHRDLNNVDEKTQLAICKELMCNEITKKKETNPVKTAILIANYSKGGHLKQTANQQLYKLTFNDKTQTYQGSHVAGVTMQEYDYACYFENLFG